MSAPSPEDRELEALSARDGRLARAWRKASREEPPPALDEAVRAAARRAVRAGPRAGHAPFAGRWRVPLSIAAVLVVSATLTLLVAERREHVPGAGPDAAPPVPATVQPPPAAARNAERGAPANEAAPRATGPSARKRAAAEPARTADESPRELYDAPVAAREPAAAPAAAQPPSIQPAPATPAAGLEPATAPSRAYERPTAAQSKPHGEDDSGAVKEEMAPRAFPEREEARADTRANAGVEATAGEAGKREAQARGMGQQASASALDPKTWIERILALRREGKLREAERSMEEFRRRYPDYPLPPELARLPASAPADNR